MIGIDRNVQQFWMDTFVRQAGGQPDEATALSVISIVAQAFSEEAEAYEDYQNATNSPSWGAEARLVMSSVTLTGAIRHLLQAVRLWVEVEEQLYSCPQTAQACGTDYRCLIELSMRRRRKLLSQTLHIEQQQIEVYGQFLQEQGLELFMYAGRVDEDNRRESDAL